MKSFTAPLQRQIEILISDFRFPERGVENLLFDILYPDSRAVMARNHFINPEGGARLMKTFTAPAPEVDRKTAF